MGQLSDSSNSRQTSRRYNSIDGINFNAITRAKFLRGFAALLLFPCFLWATEDSSKAGANQADSTFDEALDELFAKGYPQQLESYFCSLGTNPDLGFRWAGTTAEHATGIRIEEEMRKMGLRNVRREPVPVDVFEFKKATVTVGSKEMLCSAFAGVQSTPEGGITAPVVYAKGGTAVDFDAVGDVTGKIVLIDILHSSWWPTIPAFEAAHRQAAGIILTFTPEDSKYYSFHSQALGAFDSAGDLGIPPIVYICRQDGEWLKSQLTQDEVRATMILDQKVTLAKDGGVGYNVLGELPGSSHDGQLILLLAHQDAHFKGAVDNTAGFVNMLTVAKAMCASSYRPRHTIVFMATCGEEFGHINTYYDWLAGSWWAISHEHRDWIGKTRAVINVEGMGIDGTPLVMISNPELKPWLTQLAASHEQHLSFGSRNETPVLSWTDQWPFTALGIPSVTLDTLGLQYHFGAYPPRYHTNFDTQDLIDWKYLAHIAKFIHAVVRDLDDGLLPFDLEEKAKDLAATVKREELLAVGGDPAVVSRLEDSVKQFTGDACLYQARCKSIPARRLESANKQLLEIERVLNEGLTALSAIDDATIYPHQQVLADANGLKSSLAALQAVVPDTRNALEALESVGDTTLGKKFSYAVYRKLMDRKHPDYMNLYFASAGKLPIPVDVISEYRAIEKGNIATAIANLKAKHKLQILQLNKRLRDMTTVLHDVNGMMEELLQLCGVS